MKNRSSETPLALFDGRSELMCGDGDWVEGDRLVSILGSYLDGKADGDKINLANIDFRMEEDSSLNRICIPLRKMLSDFVDSDAFIDRAESKGYSNRDDVYVTYYGSLIFPLGPGSWDDLTEELKADPYDAPKLKRLAEAVNASGGRIRKGLTATVEQWLRFHGFKVPTTVGGTRKLLSFMAWKWPENDQFGNYWSYISGQDSESVVLVQDDYEEIRRLTATLCPGGVGLLNTLYAKVRSTLSGNPDWQSANETLVKLVSHTSSQALAKQYIDALGWCGVRDGDEGQAHDLAQFLLTAILVELNHFIGTEQKRNFVGTFDLHDPVLFADKPGSVIRKGLDEYLSHSPTVSNETAPLASHLLLANLAPALLVKDVPSGITLGSIGWVTFCQAVAFVEMNAKGASRFMTYDQVMKFADMEEFSSTLGQLQSLVSVDAIIDWGLVNDVISHEDLKTDAPVASETALDVYQAHVKYLAKCAQIWATAPPDRIETALEALQAAAPGCDFLSKKILRHYTDTLGNSYKMSMLDLHVEGELVGGEWDWREARSLYDVYPGLTRMSSNQVNFQRQARGHHQKLHEALASNVRLAIASMPSQDRDLFDKSEIHFFTIRPPVAEIVGQSSSSIGLTGANLSPTRPKETQARIDAATGRFGVVMYVSIGRDQYLCYEMFNLRGECRRNNNLGGYIHNRGCVNQPARLDFKGSMNEDMPAAYAGTNTPVDLDSYTNGTAPRSKQFSHAVIDKLGTLKAPTFTPTLKTSAYQYYVSPRAHAIAHFITTHRPLATVQEYTEALTVYTEREQTRATTDKVVTFIIDLVVPFKKCIEDLSSGDKNRVADGVFGCTMDAIGILFTVLGATSKVLSIASRTASMTSKLVSSLKFGLKLTVSTLNPLDGVPTLGYQLTRKLLRNGLQLGKQGAQLIELATLQIQVLTGKVDCADLLKASALPQIGKGKWRPRGHSVDIFDVSAIARNNRWYGVNRFGRPWGKPLEFDFKQAFKGPEIRRELPASYIQHVIEQSIPLVTRKIDNAIAVLSNARLNLKTDPAIGLFLGTTAEARDSLLNCLRVIKADFGGFSLSNFILDPLKDDVTIVEVRPVNFTQWKELSDADKASHQFLAVNAQNLNDRLGAAGFKYGEIADDLIHEMFRAGAGRVDRVTAAAAGENAQGLNVAALLKLAAGRLPKSPDVQSTDFHSRNEALANADSYAVTTALLSQVITDYPKFSENIETLTRAVASNDGGEVWVNMNAK
ncbi:hypothetical protein [Pseudomonas baetica]|uniref:hypothetical protein n=1 Tax=Pseudomonas baetica TaxID=674054 RepID=UPI0028719C95|nr:hypothetical protein [Pseudomonas baetica]MDR9865043.1 hypothetical protein [Pseudomonas baetica]